MESAGLKKVLTEDYLASLIHNNTRVCLQIDEQIEAENCLVGVAQDQWELRVLLTHTISSFCQWIEACHGGMYATSEPKLPKHSQVIQVKRPAPSYLDDGPDQECDQCLLLAAQVRRNMSADLITQVTSVQRKLCLRKTEEQQLHLCLDQTAYFKDLLNHLLGNAVQDYCPWANLCRQEWTDWKISRLKSTDSSHKTIINNILRCKFISIDLHLDQPIWTRSYPVSLFRLPSHIVA